MNSSLLFMTLLLTSQYHSDKEEVIIEFPNSQNLASHALNLITIGQVKDNGYTFLERDLYIGRVDHIIQVKEKSTSIEYKTSVSCNVEYQSKYQGTDQMFYLTNSIILDAKGDVLSIYPSFSFDSCTDNRDTLNNDHVKISSEIEYKPDFILLKNQAKQIENSLIQQIEAKEIHIYNHTFSTNEIDIKSISLVEYIEPKINRVVVAFTPKCDVMLKVSEEYTQMMAQLYVYLLPNSNIEKIHATFNKGTGIACSK